ncbi:MAG: hypothetical protein FJW77_08110 [Actinobacteria bacterium]|nr:hypothetical protein [Actinomycetota bacterium]
MATGGPVDPTMPLPERRGAPPAGDATTPDALPGAYDPTIAMPPVGPPDEPVVPQGPGSGGSDDRRWLWIALAVVGVIVIGVVVALLVSGGGGGGTTPATSTTVTPTSTSTSSSTSTTSTSTTVPPTTQPGAPVITSFTATPSPFPCSGSGDSGQVTLNWTTTNATGVSISIDGPGVFGSFGPSGSRQVPFASCSSAHVYTLTARGQGNAQVQQTITVQPAVTPPTTSAPVTTTTAP